MSTFNASDADDDANVEKDVFGARPCMTWKGVEAYLSRNAVFSAYCTTGTKSTHSRTFFLRSCRMALKVRTTSRIMRSHVPFNQGEFAIVNRRLTPKAVSSAFMVLFLKWDAVSLTQTSGTPSVFHQFRRCLAVNVAVHAPVGSIHAKLLRSSIIIRRYT